MSIYNLTDHLFGGDFFWFICYYTVYLSMVDWTHWVNFESDSTTYWWYYPDGLSYSHRIELSDDRFWSEVESVFIQHNNLVGELLEKTTKHIHEIAKQFQLDSELLELTINKLRGHTFESIKSVKEYLATLEIPGIKTYIIAIMLWSSFFQSQEGVLAPKKNTLTYQENAWASSRHLIDNLWSLDDDTSLELVQNESQQIEYQDETEPTEKVTAYQKETVQEIRYGDTVEFDTLISQEKNALESIAIWKTVEFDASEQGFDKYLKFANLNSFWVDREVPLGKYLRVKRRDLLMSKACKESRHFVWDKDLIAALIMTEWYWDPYSFNESDGGAGMCHIQPDVAEHDLNMTVFTRHPTYKNFGFYALLNKKHSTLDQSSRQLIEELFDQENQTVPKKWSRYNIYRLHGKLLKHIVNTDWYDFLQEVDQRFQPDVTIPKAVQLLDRVYDQAEWDKRGYLAGKWWDDIMASFSEKWINDFTKAFAINGYNKWHTRYGDNINPQWFWVSWSKNHMYNRERNLQTYRYYNEKITFTSLSYSDLIEVMKKSPVSFESYL